MQYLSYYAEGYLSPDEPLEKTLNIAGISTDNDRLLQGLYPTEEDCLVKYKEAKKHRITVTIVCEAVEE